LAGARQEPTAVRALIASLILLGLVFVIQHIDILPV
jgi:hypothetical protein